MTEILDEGAVSEIEALSAKVPDGPWFTAPDDAEDVPDHRRSGLALVETGRSADWWIARLCEWHIATFIAQSKTNIDALCATVKHLRELAYLPKILSDDEEITFQEDNGRLLREKLELQSQLEQLRVENERLQNDALKLSKALADELKRQ